MLVLQSRKMIIQMFILVAMTTTTTAGTSSTNVSSTDSISMIQRLVKKGYDRNQRPNYGKNPLNVFNHMVISTLGPINERDMTFEISFYHRQWWRDGRLATNETREDLTFSENLENVIWIPDIYIKNAKQVTYFDKFTRTVVKQDGEVFFSRRINAKCSCHMDLRRYPLDTQNCHIELESYAFNMLDIILDWKDGENAVKIPESDKQSLTGYDLISMKTTQNVVSYGSDNIAHQFGTIVVGIKVKRNSVYFAYKAFIPTVFLSIFNIGSYWIPERSMPARVTLIITTFLANMLILQSVTEQTIKVSYTTAMQVFLLFNLILYMISILEFLVLLHFSKKKSESQNAAATSEELKELKPIKRKENGISKQNSDETSEDFTDLLNVTSHFNLLEAHFMHQKKDKAHILDRIFRVLTPIVYVIFLISFFTYFTF